MQQEVVVGTTGGLHQPGGDKDILLSGHEVTALARDASDWWAILDRREVWHSSAGGEWGRVASLETMRANCLLPAAAGPIVGASEARLFTLRDRTLEPLPSFDEAPGRNQWHTPWGGPPDVRSMSADPSGTLFVNVHVGGVVRSADGGKTWEPTIDISSDVHQVLFDPGSGLLLAASALGLADSANGGQSWLFDTDGLHGNYLRAVAVAGATVLVSASTGPSTDRAAVYRKPLDGGEPFHICQQGLPEWFSDNIDTSCLTASGSRAAFGTSDGMVFVSSDEGQSWTKVAEGLPPVRCVALT